MSSDFKGKIKIIDEISELLKEIDTQTKDFALTKEISCKALDRLSELNEELCNGVDFEELKHKERERDERDSERISKLAPTPPEYWELKESFSDVKKPSKVSGDSWGLDASDEDIYHLLNHEPEKLTIEEFQAYLGYYTNGTIEEVYYLLPTILRLWREQLYVQESWYIQHAHKEFEISEFLVTQLDDVHQKAAIEFMHTSFLERLSKVSGIQIVGISWSHSWFHIWTSYGAITKDMEMLWKDWWNFTNPGHTIAALQFASCIISDEQTNPFFKPFDQNLGGGVPGLWDYESVGFDQCWYPENYQFLKKTLNFDYLEKKIRVAIQKLSNFEFAEQQKYIEAGSTLLKQMQNDPGKVKQRCDILCTLLGKHKNSPDMVFDWEEAIALIGLHKLQ